MTFSSLILMLCICFGLEFVFSCVVCVFFWFDLFIWLCSIGLNVFILWENNEFIMSEKWRMILWFHSHFSYSSWIKLFICKQKPTFYKLQHHFSCIRSFLEPKKCRKELQLLVRWLRQTPQPSCWTRVTWKALPAYWNCFSWWDLEP